MSTSFSPQIGERFAGRYELKSPLRSEGAVRAFLALDHHAGLDVALLLLDSTPAHPNAWAAFARIVAAATASKIAGLVLPQGVPSTPPAPPFCVAEPRVFRGFDKLRDQGPMPWRRALMLGERTAEILHAAHAATGVAHRILTPSRCALTIRDDVRVIDFGVAELELGSPDEAGYRAPEQRQGGGDSRSDAYTLAVILTELITNQKSAGQTPPRLRSLAAVPQPVDDFMARALSQDPAQRPDLAAMRAGLRELLNAAEATTAAAPRPKLRRDFSSLSILSAPPGARAAPSVMPSTKPGPTVGVGPGLANVASQPVRPSLPAIAKAAAPRMSRAEVDPPEALAPSSSQAPAAIKTELLRPAPPTAAPATFKTELLPPVSSTPAPAAFKTELLPPAPPTAAPAAIKTEILAPVSSTPAPALTDKTEIFPPVSSTPAPPLTDKTEIFPTVASTPAPPITDRTELLPPVLRLTPVNGERTEVVRADIAIVHAEKTAPERSLRGSFALAQAKASAAVLVASPRAAAGADPPTENNVDPLPPVDTTLLLPPEPAPPVPAVGPRPFDPRPPEPEARSTAEVRPPADRVQATASARSPTIAKPVKSSFKSTWMWIGALCLAGLVLAALWLLNT